jgi:hypothetical protein
VSDEQHTGEGGTASSGGGVHDSRIHHPALPRSPPQSASYFKRECASGRLPDRAAPDRRAIADVITRLQEVIATGYEPETWGSASLCSGLRAAVGLPRPAIETVLFGWTGSAYQLAARASRSRASRPPARSFEACWPRSSDRLGFYPAPG